ncbi:ATP-binding cassette domain-containing protein [Duncaniella freteri]|uniref:ATP-binding cassette domain-containing protein n=2 Tax=Duncaniella TaxID=2518495 RepID=UPI0033654E06
MNIVVNNLCHIFPDGTSIFSDVSFSIEAKSKCALVGANGCGKSLLMSILSGREKPAGGEVFLGDSGTSRNSGAFVKTIRIEC